jgi:hypothetical protein
MRQLRHRRPPDDWDEFVAGHRAGLIEWNTARLSPGRGGQGSARRRRELDLPLSRIVEARENILAGFPALLHPLTIRAVTLRPILVLARPADWTTWSGSKDVERSPIAA